MNRRLSAGFKSLAAVLVLACSPAMAASTAIVGARILPVSAPEIAQGTVVIGDDGRILAVGSTQSVEVPADARRIEGAGLVVYPGLIDSDTSLGLAEQDMDFTSQDVMETSTPVFPQGRVADAFNPDTAHLEVVRANGITHVVVAPADRMPVTGQSALVQLADGPDGYILRSPLALHVNMSDRAKGTGSAPKTRMGVAALLRQLFADAQKRVEDPSAGGPPDPKLDTVASYLRDKRPVVISATSSQDVRLALELAREFNLNLVLSDVIDADDQFDAIAAAGVPVIVGPILALPADDQHYDAHFRVPAQLAKRGIRFAFASGGVYQIHRFMYPRLSQMRNLPYLAGIATGYGLDEATALQALTLAPAQIWGIAEHAGSIEAGKPAHLVVATGSPLEPTTDVRHVFINGDEVPLDSYQSRLRDRYRSTGDHP